MGTVLEQSEVVERAAEDAVSIAESGEEAEEETFCCGLCNEEMFDAVLIPADVRTLRRLHEEGGCIIQ